MSEIGPRARWAPHRLGRITGAVAVVLVIGLAGGCGGGSGSSAHARKELRLSLDFLRSDLEPPQLHCVERRLIKTVDDLHEFSAQMRRVDAGDVQIEDLPADNERALTEAISRVRRRRRLSAFGVSAPRPRRGHGVARGRRCGRRSPSAHVRRHAPARGPGGAGRARVGALAGGPPVGGGLVGQRGDGGLDAGGEPSRVLALGRPERCRRT